MMEYAKDEIFSVCYLKEKDKLKKSICRRVIKKIQKNKFLTLLFMMGTLFSILNFTLIYYFFILFSKI